MDNTFYIYAHLNPETNEVFYIGKGTGRRVALPVGRNNDWHEYVNNLDGNFKFLVLKDGLEENEAFILESRLIKKIKGKYDGGTLVNFSGHHGIGISIITLSESVNNVVHKYQNITDEDIIKDLLNFPDWSLGEDLERKFNKDIYQFIYEKYNKNCMDEGLSDLESILSETYQIISDFKHGFYNYDEFILQLEDSLQELKEFDGDNLDNELEQILIMSVNWIEQFLVSSKPF
jgi:hypothetical protein